MEKSGFFDILEAQDIVMADRGFSCLAADLASRSVHLIVPPGKPGEVQMTKGEVKKTKDVHPTCTTYICRGCTVMPDLLVNGVE